MKQTLKALCGAGLCAAALQGCDSSVSYSKDVLPILEAKCIECHSQTRKGEGYVKSGLSMDSYAELMKGTKFGAVVKPGESFTSALVMLVEGRADPSIKMPHNAEEKDELRAAEIAAIKDWIDQGAKNN